MKNGSKGAWPRSLDLLFNLWYLPLISLERLKLQSSNLACRLIVRDTKPKHKKWVERGRGLGHVTYFSNFETPNISGTAEGTNFKFCMRIEGKE